jgi:hypothetical protein
LVWGSPSTLIEEITVSNNTDDSRRPKRLNAYRVVSMLALAALLVMGSILVARPAPTSTEIAQAVNGPVKFERPSAMEYVAKTNSCVVGGTVTSAKWHVGNKTVDVGEVAGSTVDYTEFVFKSDDGRVFTVSQIGAFHSDPGQNLGLELDCDPATMTTAQSFELIATIYGGK